MEGGGDSVVGSKICLVVVCCPEVHEGCPGIKEKRREVSRWVHLAY